MKFTSIKGGSKMKKLLVLTMVAVMIMVSGCSKNGNTEQKSDDSKASNKIVFLAEVPAVPEEEQAWKDVAASFKDETGIEVELRFQGTWSEIPQALQTAKLAGDQIDLVRVGIGAIRSTLGSAKMVMDMTDLMADLSDRFPEGILNSCYIGGKLWAFPYADGSATTCLYNKTLFAELGIKPPTTFDEWLIISKTISEKKDIIPMIFQGKDGWAWPMMYFDTYAQASGNKAVENVEAFLKGEYEFTGAEEQKAFDLIKQIADNKIMTSETFDTDEEGMIATFSQQKAAMMFCGTWDYDSVVNAADFEVGAFEFPLMVEGSTVQHGFGVGDGAISIPSFANQDNLENSMRFVEYILRPENAKKILLTLKPKFEVVKGAAGERDEVTQFLNDVIAKHSVTYLDWIWPTQINDAFSQTIPAVASGNMTSAEAVQYVQDTYKTLLEEQDYSYDWWTTWSDKDWEMVTPKAIPDVKKFVK